MPWKPLGDEKFPSLGWHVADQMAEFLAAPARVEYEPFLVTREQLQFLVDLYEIDPSTGKRVKNQAVLQRSRGWGKSPVLGGVGIAEALFEVVPDGWDANGQPVARPWSTILTPTVLIAAVSEEQVRNTWQPMLEMLRDGPAVDEFDIEPMDTFIALPKGRIEPRASSARAVKGAPGQVAAIMDQTEEWVAGNHGHQLAQNLRNNAYKTGGLILESPNAFTPGDNSVAEQSAKSWERMQSGKIADRDVRSILYDHREAPAETDVGEYDSLVAGLRFAYGDSSNYVDGCVLHEPPCAPGWAPVESIALAFLNPSNDPQKMRADFLNQITHATNSFVSQPELRAIVADKKISKSEPVTLGFDGSEGRKRGIADSTVLVGYSVSQKHLFKIGLWEQPEGPSGVGWRPPKLEVEAAVVQAFADYNVVGFYADPSAGWAGDVKTWESKYFRRLKAKMSTAEPIRWRQKDLTRTCDTFDQLYSAITAGEITFDGSSSMIKHFLAARRDPRRAGYVLKKPDDDQDFSKIDLTWGSMFAFAAGMDALGKGVSERKVQRVRRIY